MLWRIAHRLQEMWAGTFWKLCLLESRVIRVLVYCNSGGRHISAVCTTTLYDWSEKLSHACLAQQVSGGLRAFAENHWSEGPVTVSVGSCSRDTNAWTSSSASSTFWLRSVDARIRYCGLGRELLSVMEVDHLCESQRLQVRVLLWGTPEVGWGPVQWVMRSQEFQHNSHLNLSVRPLVNSWLYHVRSFLTVSSRRALVKCRSAGSARFCWAFNVRRVYHLGEIN